MPPRQRSRLVTAPRARQKMSFAPVMRQALQMWSQRGMAISRMIKALADDNPYLDVIMPPQPRSPSAGMNTQSLGVNSFDHFTQEDIRPVSLAVHLFAVIGEVIRNPEDRAVALAMVPHVSPAGWLEATGLETARAMGCDGARLDHLLQRLQSVEPVGLFARNLSECLRLQIEDRGEMTADLDLMLDHLDVLADRGISALADATGIDAERAAAGLAALRRCNPKPGAAFIHDEGDIFCPDLIIRQSGGGFEVTVNKNSLPQINLHADMAADDDASRLLKAEAEKQMRELNSALQIRQDMLLSAGAVIINHQQAFLKKGEVALLPLTMSTVAEQLACHKSTVSRLVADKLCETPRGMLELKAFFSPAIKQPDGTVLASRAVAARVAQLIASEDEAGSLSDQAIVNHLARDGISIARRTVAKYRKQTHL